MSSPDKYKYTCRYCGKPGASCSPKTSAHQACYHNREGKDRFCTECGKKFYPNRESSYWCSPRCYQDSKLPAEFNRRYFEQETPRVAYHAGFLVADGCIRIVGNSARVRVKIHEKDIEYLEALRQDMGASHSYISYGTYKSRFALTPSVSFGVSHPDLIVGLERWGVVPRKSLEGIAPQSVPKELIPHYIRGLIDGDGWITLYKNKYSTSMRAEMGLLCHPSIANWVIENCPWPPLVMKEKSHKGPTIKLRWAGYKTIKPLLMWLGYSDESNLALNRKREVAMKVLSQDNSNVGAAGRKGVDNTNAKLTPIDVREIRKGIAAGTSRVELGRVFGVSRDTIAAIQHGRCWVWLTVILLLFMFSWNSNASPTYYGCYEGNCRAMYPDLARLNFRDMAKRGFTTATISGNADLIFGPTPAIGLARQLDMMIEEGLVTSKKPMLCLSSAPKDVIEAKQYAQYPDKWPELVCGNDDEPNYKEIGGVRQIASDIRTFGLRNGTAIAGYSLFQRGDTAFSDGVIADWLDMWIVLASTWQTNLYEQAKQQDANLYAYWAHDRNPDTDRYVTGLWCWRWNPEVFYHWAYNHSGLHGTLPNGKHLDDPLDRNSLALGSIRGPVPTPSLLAVQEGIKDHKLLDKLKDSGKGGVWLKELWDSIPVCCPAPPKPCPYTDWKELRKQITRRLEQ